MEIMGIVCLIVSIVLFVDLVRFLVNINGKKASDITTMLCSPFFGMFYGPKMKTWIGILIWQVEALMLALASSYCVLSYFD